MWRKEFHVKARCRLPRIAAESCGDVMGKDGRDAIRVTTTLTRSQYAEVERIAKQNGVAVAWLVRRSVEQMIENANGGPMLPNFDGSERHAQR